MKKNINELKPNPINPRKISKDKRQKLKLSIFLFPKMLLYRDIVVAEDESTVLCGNQRFDILNEILNSSPVDWMLSLDESEKWKKLSATKQEEVIDFWKTWVEYPIVQVTIGKDLTEDEKKELTIKDNNEYGEYDYDKLTKMYDEVTLVGFGFDESIFYKVDEDETVLRKNQYSKGAKKINVLVFGKNSVAVTKQEYDKLVEVYDSYVDELGVDFGFVRYLLNKLKAHQNGNN